MIHKFNINNLPDSEFYNGELKYLVKGNYCRSLDGRRTPGYIEEIFEDSAVFRWRITDFEDKGSYWDVPVWTISQFQFSKDSQIINEEEIVKWEEIISAVNTKMEISINLRDREETEKRINARVEYVIEWIKNNSQFIKSKMKLNFDSTEGNKLLSIDLNDYMKFIGLYDLEKKTASQIVLNPYSGEWMKGMDIVFAELGLVSYKGKIPVEKNIFCGIGSKKKRKDYIINRLAFIRAYYKLLDIDEVILYRGMSTEGKWEVYPKTFSSWTFSLDVSKSFAELDKGRNSYIMKRTVAVSKIFMSYLETEEMNNQYKEAEALLIFNENEGFI